VPPTTGYIVTREGVTTILVDGPPFPPTWKVPKGKPKMVYAPSLKDAIAQVTMSNSYSGTDGRTEEWLYHRVLGINSLVYIEDVVQASSLINPLETP